MYSVDDLLISHGYKPSRDHAAPRKGSSKECRPARTRTRAGADQGLLNGYEDGSAVCARNRTSLGTGHLSDSESRRSAPRGQGASASRTPEAGFYNQAALAWSSQPQVGSNHTYWGRGGQEGSDALGPRGREGLQVRGMAQAHSLPAHVREGPWEVAGRTEHVTKKAVWEDELRTPGPNVGLESWKHPRQLGRQMSDGDGEKLFQDLHLFVQGERALTAQNKKKSRSLPRVLSPEGLSCTEIPLPLHDGHFPEITKMSPYPPGCEPGRNPERGGSSGPFPQPKFGKPLKPPSYASHHQQARAAEGHFQEHRQHLDPRGSFPTRTDDPRHEPGASEPGLEPPVYVPPPSYRSPPQHIPNPYLEEPTPRLGSGGHSPQQQQQLPEKVMPGCPLPSGSLAAGSHYGASPGSSPRGLPAHPHPTPAYEGSVEYIPFDDPRIRHIRLAQPPGFCEEAKSDDRPCNSGLRTALEPAPGRRQCDGALLPPRDPAGPSGSERGPAFANASPRWLRRHVPGDRDSGGFPGQPGEGVGRGPRADGGAGASSPHSWAESTCTAHTKLRKFETGIQTKKSSKKKASETIFCLVSIPVKSEPHLPATDRNNNDLKARADRRPGLEDSAALPEQSLLSASCTDLELQALTGSLATGREFPRQDLGEPGDNEQTHDLRFVNLTKHRVLQSSGSWPGHQHRDQQTQTSFPEDSRSSQFLLAPEPGGVSNAAPIPKCLDLSTPKAQPHVVLASGDQKQKPSGPNLRGQTSLSPSSNSAFSWTSSATHQASAPKGDPGQPCVDIHRQGPKPEVVKGEPTAGPCNSKPLFGQFLLKPVSRRPWDLISQLESFNKELQEEEDHRSSSSEESEAEQQENCAHPTPRTQQRPRPRVLELGDPGFQASENCTEEPQPHHPRAHGPLPSEDHRVASFQQVDRSPMAEQQERQVVNGAFEPAVSPGPMNRMVAATKATAPSYLAEQRGSRELSQGSDASGAVQPSRGAPPEVDGREERSPVAPLSLANKNRGLSAPDLRSLGLAKGQEQSACKLEESSGAGSASEIAPSESLQERAVRILGIEVAVESLLPGARRAGQSPSPEPRVSACSPQPPREDSLPSSAPSGGTMVTTDAFYGRRKCGWTESPLFVGERAPPVPPHSDVDGVPSSQATTPEPELRAKPPFRATLVHFIERTSSVAGSEKRLRSPSKVIESLQEKLTSPPRRADPDRLMRMKEVSSVSRMRCLSFRSADSVEEAQAWQSGGLTSLNTGDQAWRTSVSKADVSREESRHFTAQREKQDQDFWSPGEELGIHVASHDHTKVAVIGIANPPTRKEKVEPLNCFIKILHSGLERWLRS
uniref:Junctional cadherin 5 associated n=1 Tax=Jaculus jaculus TaxID=51337 RepID=A0A8C5NW93_JACJA